MTDERYCRQQCGSFILDVGTKLKVSQKCMSTATVYMHRFFTVHAFSEVQRFTLATAALFLAVKVEEQARKGESVIRSAQVIRAAHEIYNKGGAPLDVRSEEYKHKQYQLIGYENALLQTLGFDLNLHHPHKYIVHMCKVLKASQELSDAAFILATASLILTTMCLQHKPRLVACVCIHLACKWTGWELGSCSKGKAWFNYVDETATMDVIETLSQEFLAILETSPAKFVKRFKNAGMKICRQKSEAPLKRSISVADYLERVREKKPRDPRPKAGISSNRGILSLPLPPFYSVPKEDTKSRKRSHSAERGVRQAKMPKVDAENVPPPNREEERPAPVSRSLLKICFRDLTLL